MDAVIWLSIVVCISQSAMFSGLNLAFFSISRLELELEMSKGNARAFPIAALRKDSNFLLATILWGNVGVNVLLTLLSGSVLAGVLAFLFSTFVITIVGEIIPQAYLSRNAMSAASFLAPMIRLYQVLLYPLAKPTAIVLNIWLGEESTRYVKESDLVALLRLQKDQEEHTEISNIESAGMINFANIDKLTLLQIGQAIDSDCIITLQNCDSKAGFPEPGTSEYDELIEKVRLSTRRWFVLTDRTGAPRVSLDCHALVQRLYRGESPGLSDYCRAPVVFSDPQATFLDGLKALKADTSSPVPGRHSVFLYWSGTEKRIITASDFMYWLSQGILYPEAPAS
ncbi:MAG: Mg2+ and Co2+ transporter CorB [Halioglobus sp.]|nr:Mg2+ and Co2+ transporter CorB [Halioglobus sp.]|tara:strand:+ start:1606 stop:2625 length:1020 start_codon:yes stop_codon:yes gene_type:complete